ncbi:MAG TPA: polysaccharide biosynthesis protein [Vicinamibacterales bacterium]|nr:polysaccharide biosynthesis protein [Vicinamibacterales bacterium]
MDLTGKRILVTGGTGSLGQVLVRRLLSGERGRPSKVIVLSRDEAKQHEMRLSYQHRQVSTDEVIYRNFQQVLEFRIGDVRSYADVCGVVRDSDIVFNAAALKQVPVCEYFPEQALLTNCMGAVNLVRAIGEFGLPVETVVGISTDKACKPVNVMGMSKAIAERIFAAANVLNTRTRFVCVRYGNVLASRGSVIPLFHQQIQRGGPVTVTADTMTRFLMTLDQAVDTVFEAVEKAAPGEIVVPLAPSANVIDIAKALIGGRPIDIRITEVRPGEKEHEILVSEEECRHTYRRGSHYVITPRLPELRRDMPGNPEALNREYSSADSPVGLEQTIALLEENRLMVGQVDLSTAELLR